MAISHVCIPCGYDLAHVHTVCEPHYGLRIVRCPQCDAVAVRRRHPLVNVKRLILRFDMAAGLLLLQLLLIPTATLGTFSSIVGVMTITRDYLFHHVTTGQRDSAFIGALIGILGGTAIGIGMWLTIAFAHWRQPILAWLAWTVWMVMFIVCVPLVAAAFAGAVHVDAVLRTTHPPDDFAANATTLLRSFTIPALGVFALMMVTSTIGIAPGMVWLRVWGALRRARWRSRLRRRRRGRTR